MGDLAAAERTAEELRSALGRVVRRLRRESGMPVHHVTALRWLEREGPKTTSALAAAEHITPQSMAATLTALHEQGLADRTDDPQDRRQVLWSCTARGREVLAADRRRRARWLVTAIDEGLTAQERALLQDAAALLNKIMDQTEGRSR